MLYACTSCGSKIRIPDGLAGKKGKCPKCGIVFTIPEAPAAPAPEPKPRSAPDLGLTPAPRTSDRGAASPAPEPKPPTVPDLGLTPAPGTSDGGAAPPASEPKLQPLPDLAITSTPRTSDRGTAPPPVLTPAAPPPLPPPSEPTRVSRSRRDDFDDEDDDYDRDRRRSRRRDRDDDDDDDYDDIRRKLRKRPEETGLALSSMIVGIVSASLGVFGICCWIVLAPLAGIGGVVAVILGFMGRSRGGESQAITGIVLGFVAIGLAILWTFCGIFWMGFNILGGMR